MHSTRIYYLAKQPPTKQKDHPLFERVGICSRGVGGWCRRVGEGMESYIPYHTTRLKRAAKCSLCLVAEVTELRGLILLKGTLGGRTWGGAGRRCLGVCGRSGLGVEAAFGAHLINRERHCTTDKLRGHRRRYTAPLFIRLLMATLFNRAIPHSCAGTMKRLSFRPTDCSLFSARPFPSIISLPPVTINLDGPTPQCPSSLFCQRRW